MNTPIEVLKLMMEEAKKYAAVETNGIVLNDPAKYSAFRDGQKSGYSIANFINQITYRKSQQDQAYEYIMEHCDSHFLAQRQLYTAYITLGYDHQKYGNSEYEAKDTLATYLSTKKHIQEMIAEILFNSDKNDAVSDTTEAETTDTAD